jgi:hypothetical protein
VRHIAAACLVAAVTIGAGAGCTPGGRWAFAVTSGGPDPARALVAIARVGSEPVGLAAVRDGTLLVVANSNRFGASGQSSSLSVVSVTAALAGRQPIVGDLPTGLFPRDMAVSPDGRCSSPTTPRARCRR